MTSPYSTLMPYVTSVTVDDVTDITWPSAAPTGDYNGSSNATMSDYACYSITDDPAVLLSHRIYLFVSIVLVVVGLVGNTLSFLVFSSKEMRTVSSNVYLLVLAISDSFYLVSVFLTKILTTLRCLYFTSSAADISNRSGVMCKLLQFLLDLFSDYSTCLIMAFTIERYFAVYKPIKFKEMCTVSRARLSCLVVGAVIAITITPYHYLYIGRFQDFNVCTVLVNYEDIFTAFYVSEMILYRVVPVFIIAVLNVFIVVRVTQVTRRRKQRKASVVVNNIKKKKQKREDRSMQLTIMLILVSTSYIIAYLPVLIHFIVWKLQRSGLITISDEANVIWQNYARAMYISGFAINFFLYTMSGRVFREQLEHIILDCDGSASKREKEYTHVTTADTSVV